MEENLVENISQCQTALKQEGFFVHKIQLPKELKTLVLEKNYNEIDKVFTHLTKPNGQLFIFLKEFCSVNEIEFIISLRESKNSWEEDGIWHDDGSRILAFSLSLTIDSPTGGVLELRKKGNIKSRKIPTPNFGEIIVFKTGVDNYEHKINKVVKGSRLIVAGWCYP